MPKSMGASPQPKYQQKKLNDFHKIKKTLQWAASTTIHYDALYKQIQTYSQTSTTNKHSKLY